MGTGLQMLGSRWSPHDRSFESVIVGILMTYLHTLSAPDNKEDQYVQPPADNAFDFLKS